ncbi:MAG TPA: glutathione S-transferase N-terminal domain-containing protein [Beijerinckiaceae bacterium]
MIQFYYSLAPNPMKVALMLEETGLAYEPVPVDTRKGEQHGPEILKLNPNAKVPIIVDGEAVVFDSSAILMYLAEKTGQFGPGNSPKERGDFLSWQFFVSSGIGPYSGQAVHFKHFAPEPIPYAQTRYMFEAKRHYAILDERLKHHRYMLGDAYTILDMNVWGWTRMVPFLFGEEGYATYPNVKRHLDEISARPAAARVNALRERHAFKAEMDEEARRHMFRHLDQSAA